MLEYADVIFDNCPSYLSDKLEKINIEAARIVTGATRLVSHNLLLNECGWETLAKRRETHKLILFFKILNNMTPAYLKELLPPTHDQIHNYTTRNSGNIIGIQCRTTHLYNSFFPSCTRLWNNLPASIKQSTSIKSFKESLSSSSEISKIPFYFNTKSRHGQILHARLRMRCSSLNQHLYLKNIVPDPVCSCGEIESTAHYLLDCPNYTDLRNDMLTSINYPVSTNLLLYGNVSLPDDFNTNVFNIVENFILKSRRFN